MKLFPASVAATLLFLFSGLSYSEAPADFWHYPTIKKYGPVHIWPDAIEKPSPQKTYKALFDVTKTGEGLDKVSPGLSHVARTINNFTEMGAPMKNLKFTVIIHGGATPIAMSKEAFEAKFHYANPNLELIDELTKAGVDVLVCGNSLGDRQLTPADVNPKIKIAGSALSTLIIKQNDGYALLRL